ncbi:MAG: beta-glucanase [Deltaproteobacteria bacterium]|nr:MAG: beta-glucanase [Deltaproteobacteria bacterium]
MKRPQKFASIMMILALGVFAFLTAFASESPNYPFPQHLTYGKGTILPNQYPREWMDDDARAFYDYWKGEYLAQAGEDKAGNPLFRITFGHPGSSNYGTTVSEGQGYGMIIVALMAGHDPGAKTIFDGLWRFAKQHPSEIDSRLMAWRVSEDNPQEGDNDSAFDGDADIAFALLLADRQWGSDQEIDYASDARTMIKAIYKSTVGPRSRLPMLGDWVEANGSEYNQYTNRTSDFMLVNFQAFFRFTHHRRWKRVVNKSRGTARILQKKYSPTTGLLPDFIEPVSDSNHDPRPADPYFLEGENDGNYYYNACRVPLRIGMDALLNKKKVSKRIVRKISRWAERYHSGSPYSISTGYTLDGNPVPGSNYLSTAFVAPLGVAAMNVPAQQVWLNSIYDAINQEHQDYFDDTLNLLSL